MNSALRLENNRDNALTHGDISVVVGPGLRPGSDLGADAGGIKGAIAGHYPFTSAPGPAIP